MEQRARSISGQRDESIAIVCDADSRRRQHVVDAVVAQGSRAMQIAGLPAVPGAIEQRQPFVVILGCDAASSADVLAVAARLRRRHAHLAIVVIVGDSTEAMAIAALRAGATDYLAEPLADGAVAAALRRCRGTSTTRDAPDPLVGTSPALLAACGYLDRAARTKATVLITGETGTGKELAAYRVHQASGRQGRFVPVNCAAIPDTLLESELFGHESGAFTGATRSRDGLLQLADRGTIFLDEVGDMGQSAQAKILRAIETREVFRVGGRHATPLDVRIVAATNHDLEHAVEEGRFRKDLFFRLNVVRVHLPPLRERRCDIPALIDHYLRTLGGGGAVEGFAAQTLDALVAYDWPGNVRELRNLIESVFVTAPPGRLGFDDLPQPYRERLARYCGLPDAERARLMEALLAADWNKSRAAEMLHWSRMTLYRKLAKYSVVTSAPADEALRRGRRAPRRNAV